MPVRVELMAEAFADLVRYAQTGNLPLFLKKLIRLEDVGRDAGLPLGRGLTGWRKIVVGDRNWRIIFLAILPNCMGPLIVQTTLSMASAILDAAALSFLGLGAQPPTPEWGAMIARSRSRILRASWVMTFPGLAILLAVLGFNLLGDGLRDALDPRLRD